MSQYPPYDYHQQHQQQPQLPYHPVALQSPTLDPTHSLTSFAANSKEGLAEGPLAAQHAQQKARSKRPLSTILLYSLGVLLLTILPTAVLLLYIFVINTAERFGTVILTTANLQNVLAVTQVITTVVGKSVGVVCTVFAYSAASRWLKSSQQPGGQDRPSPLQLGLLISVLQGANIVSWVKSRAHMSRMSADSKRHTLRIPTVLSRAVFVLGVLLLLSNALTACDTWLHLSSRAATIPLNSAYPNRDQALYGRTLNETRCTWFDDQTAASLYNTYGLCGLDTQGSGNTYGWGLPEGLRTLSNASALNRVAFTTDNHAILVPATVSNDVTYIASTTGIYTTCASISHQCMSPDSTGHYQSSNAAGVVFDCTKASPSLNLTSLQAASTSIGLPELFAIVNSTGNLDFRPNAAATNPFPFAGVILSSAYADRDQTFFDETTFADFVNNTGFFAAGSTGGTNIISCNISVRDVQYRYSAPQAYGTSTPLYETLSSTNSPARMAKILGSMVQAGSVNTMYMRDRVPAAVEGTGITDGSYADAFAIEFSRELMALGAYVFMPQGVSDIVTTQQKFGSRIQVAPLGVYVGLTLLYCLTVLIIGLSAIFTANSTPFVHLAHFRVTSPLSFMHALFGPVDSVRTWKEDGLGVFSRESETDRLLVGPVATPRGDVAFGVTRQPVGGM